MNSFGLNCSLTCCIHKKQPNKRSSEGFVQLFFLKQCNMFVGSKAKSCSSFHQTTTADQLLEFFKQVGDVKFVRMAGDETQPTRFAFVEFIEQESVARALTLNGVTFGDRPLK